MPDYRWINLLELYPAYEEEVVLVRGDWSRYVSP